MFLSYLPGVKPRVPYSEAVAHRLLAGLSEGRGLRALCRGPHMPTRPTVMLWLRQRPDFADEVAFARLWGGLNRPGRPSGYKAGVVDEIYLRLCEGGTLRDICSDPALPSRSTVHTWMRREPEFAEVLAFARDMAVAEAATARWKALYGS